MITCILQKLYNNADAHTSIRAWASRARNGLNIVCVASVETGRGLEGRGKGRGIGKRG